MKCKEFNKLQMEKDNLVQNYIVLKDKYQKLYFDHQEILKEHEKLKCEVKFLLKENDGMRKVISDLEKKQRISWTTAFYAKINHFWQK